MPIRSSITLALTSCALLASLACGEKPEPAPIAEPRIEPAKVQAEAEAQPEPAVEAADVGLTLSDIRTQLGLPVGEALQALPEDGGEKFNRLVFSTSPYLLQHAANAVDWHPWDEQAFALAISTRKPIFLSIGYSSCHWCHVMERESFQDQAIAEVLNQRFICIKLDREERPDIDDQYQSVIRTLSGDAGWPGSLLLTPMGGAFAAGTYFPPQATKTKPAFSDWLSEGLTRWDEMQLSGERGKLASLGRLPTLPQGSQVVLPELGDLGRRAVNALVSIADEQYGGFGEREGTRFPRGHLISFLLQYAQDNPKSDARYQALATLDALAKRGVHDHLVGGFHRYALDRQWLQPHFEKMLYDQATLAMAYAEAYALTKDEKYAAISRSTIDFVLNDLRMETGGFASAMNATLDHEVSEIFGWRKSDVMELLGAEQGELFCAAYGVSEEGSLLDEVTGENTGLSVLWQAEEIAALAERFKLSEAQVESTLEKCRAKLLAARKERKGLLVDAKMLVDLNGLFLAALARAGKLLKEERYLVEAKALANRLLMARDSRGLVHDPAARKPIAAMLPDYAGLAYGLLQLADATGDEATLASALQVTSEMIDRFGDQTQGGFWMRALRRDQETRVANYQPHFDLAYPSGAGLAMQCLVEALRHRADPSMFAFAERSFNAMLPAIAGYEQEHANTLMAVREYVKLKRE